MRGLRVRILPGLPFLQQAFCDIFTSTSPQGVVQSEINEEVGAMDRVLDFIRESRAELKKVTWPTKKQVWYSTIVVVVLTVIVGGYLGLVDVLLTAVFSSILQ